MKSEYGWGNNTMKWVLPDPVDPPDYICYLVQVPNSKFHITAFLGQIYDLSLWWNWERDDAHTARLAAYRWRKIWHYLQPVPCLPPVSNGGDCNCEDDCMGCCLKFINGVLSTKDCDGNWVPVPGQNTSGASSGGGAPQPQPGGGQQAYDLCVNASAQIPLPTKLSTGDTISIESFSGAWNDPSNDTLTWRGPQGQVYFAGAYLPGTQELIGTDPLPTAPHMSLIALINGTYYPLLGGTLTIPGGVSNAQVLLQANDSVLSDNQGQICATLNVVNNQAGTYIHTFQFNLSAFPVDWSIVNNPAESPAANGSYGPPYQGNSRFVTGSPNNTVQSLGIHSTVPAQLTRIIVDGTLIYGSTNVPGTWDTVIIQNGATVILSLTDPVTPVFPLDTGPISITVTDLLISLASGVRSDGAAPGGSESVVTVTVEGIGTDPY